MADGPYTTERLNGEIGADLDRAASLLRDGDSVAIPTETVYGLAADALSEEAVAKVFQAKGRPSNNPLIVHVASIAQARSLTTAWSPEAEALAEAFWPGPLTMVLPAVDGIARTVLAGGTTVGLRWPAHPLAQEIIRRSGLPLAAPSANLSNRISPTCASVVGEQLSGRIAAIVDGGPCQVGIESTVVDLTGNKPRVLRPGMISESQLLAVLDLASSSDEPHGHDGVLKSPGNLPKHYAPLIPVYLVDNTDGIPEDGFSICFGEESVRSEREIRVLRNPESFAQSLYGNLWSAEQSGASAIYIEKVPMTEEWSAIRDRLSRAAFRDSSK